MRLFFCKNAKKTPRWRSLFYMQYMTGFFAAIATQNDAGAECSEKASFLITEANWSSIEDE